MIDVRDVSFTYGSGLALDGVSFTVSRADFAAIVGRNGSGKTTLARCMAGFLKPASGQIRISGRDIRKLKARERVATIGYVFQNPDHQLFRESVEDEVAFGLANVGVPREDAARRVTQMLERLELADKRHLHPFRLARGDRQRLAIAAVAVLEPEVLVVDEPTTGQDPVKAREIMAMLVDLNQRRNTTIAIITHAMDLVAEYARTVVVMVRSRLIAVGGPRDIFANARALEEAALVPPPAVRIDLQLGMNPLPLNVRELVARQASS